MLPIKEIERSIIKKYRKYIWAPFITALNTFSLVQSGDKIAAYIDGSAQSYLMAKCLQEVQKHGRAQFDLQFYTFSNDANIYQTANSLSITLKTIKECSPKNAAKALNANKISLATVFERTAEQVFIKLLNEGKFCTKPPNQKLCGVTIIRPMYFIKEKGTVLWQKNAGLNLAASQPIDENVRTLLNRLNQTYYLSEFNIVKSLENVNLDTIIRYKDGDKIVRFTDNF